MRILMMTDTPENPDSGAAGTEFQTAAALRKLGHEVETVWSDQLPRRVRHGNLHYLLELPFTYRARMLERLRSRPYDVVHVNQPHGYLAARAARCQAARPVFVHRSHGFEARVAAVLAGWRQLDAQRPLLRQAASRAMAALLEFNHRAIARDADGHLVSAELCAAYLADHYGISRARIAVVAQAPPSLYQQRPAPVFDPARLDRILYVGQLAFVKAPMVLAEAFEQILGQRPQATLTWVCAAQHHPAAAALLGPLGRQRVSFVDWLGQPELMAIYDNHGIFLFPSFFEGFGKAFLEAMTRGLAVVASAEGGARDLIRHGHNGFLVAPGDAAEMARACLALQSNPALAQRVGQQARETGLVHTWQRVARETAGFYQRLMEQR